MSTSTLLVDLPSDNTAVTVDALGRYVNVAAWLPSTRRPYLASFLILAGARSRHNIFSSRLWLSNSQSICCALLSASSEVAPAALAQWLLPLKSTHTS